MPGIPRRSFLLKSSAAVMTANLAGRVVASPNEKIVTALIGCGGRGQRYLEHVDFLCDPDRSRLGSYAERMGIPAERTATDLREILDHPAVDAVVIATPDHWHTPAALLASDAGKHVYVEKPISHNFHESQLLVAAAQRNKTVVQHGTQMRSEPFVIEAVQQLRDGVIGDVLVARAWNVQKRGNIGHAMPSEPPPGVDYDTWVGPAEFLPYQSNRFHYDWHWWYNFGTGDIGNDGAHEIDFARWGLGVDCLPSTVTAVGGKYFHDDDQQFPDTATCVYEYPGDGQVGHRRQIIFEMRLWSTNSAENCDSGVEFFGTKGRMFLSKRGKFAIYGERNKVVERTRWEREQETEGHFRNFQDAIRNSRPPSAGVEEAHRSVALIHLSNIAIRTGRPIHFDPAQEKVIGDPEAEAMLTRKYREGGHWSVPG